MEAVTILQYLRSNLNDRGDFLAQWGSLTPQDKDDMKEYAKAEMGVLGIPVK